MRRKRMEIERVTLMKSAEALEEAIEDYNSLSQVASVHGKHDIYMNNLTRRHNWRQL